MSDPLLRSDEPDDAADAGLDDADAASDEARGGDGEAPEGPRSEPPREDDEQRGQAPIAPTELGRIVDREAHDAATGARALYRVDVPPAWLEEGGTLELEVPKRLPCARCEGGGCEGCANAGALRVGDGPRTVEITLARGPAGPKRVRLDEPFGEASAVRQLWIDLLPAAKDAPTGGDLHYEPAPRPLAAPARRSRAPAIVAFALALALLYVLLKGR
jgi:hypothetical protein